MYYLTAKINQYLRAWRRARNDFTNNIPCPVIENFPVSGNEGLYGWTFLPGDGKIRRREDLYGTEKGKETDVHESIHTPDERETRYLTRWILENVLVKKEKYGNNPLNYQT